MDFEAILRSHCDELFISHPGRDAWGARDFALKQGGRLLGRLEQAGFEGVRGSIEIWPVDDVSTPRINEAEQTRLVAVANGHKQVVIIFDFKGQVDFSGTHMRVPL